MNARVLSIIRDCCAGTFLVRPMYIKIKTNFRNQNALYIDGCGRNA